MKKRLGIALIFMGILIFLALTAARLTFVNALLCIPAVLIVGGLVLHVHMLKKESEY